MKILCVLLFTPLLLQAQNVRWETVQKSTTVNNADTVYFAFRGAGIFSSSVAEGDTLALNPPDQVVYGGEATVTVRKVSGTAADSLIAYAKAVDFAGRIIQADSAFIFGASYAAPGTPNSYGDGRVYGATISSLRKYVNGFVIIYKMFDLTGGTRRWEWGIATP